MELTYEKENLGFGRFSLSVCARVSGSEPLAVSWTPASLMHQARAFFAAAELPNGNILVAGGFEGNRLPPTFADSEIYNWHTGLWTVTACMNNARSAPVAVQLENGRVLVIGGLDGDGTILNSAEIYDPQTNTWSLTGSMDDARFEDFVAVLLPAPEVLIAGGSNGSLK
jgi:N-acetylneuraminic acid mutarotase